MKKNRIVKISLVTSAIFCFSCLDATAPDTAANEDKSAPAIEIANGGGTIICGEYEYEVGGRVFKDVRKFHLDVINAELADSPEVAAILGFNKATACEEAGQYIAYMQKSENEIDVLPEDGLNPEIQSYPREALPLAKTSILGANGSKFKKGAVGIINASGPECTGSMINHNSILTSAHCVDVPLNLITNDPTIQMTIHYYDPDISEVRQITNQNEWVSYWIYPNYRGNGDTERDIAILQRIGKDWSDTAPKDYLRLYTGSLNYARNSVVYGRGYNSYFFKLGLGVLRYEPVYIDWYGTYHFWDMADENYRLCRGDSGGPWIRNDDRDDLIVGISSNVDAMEHLNGYEGDCAEYGVKQRATRINMKINWIEDVLGFSCTDLSTTDNRPYKRCW